MSAAIIAARALTCVGVPFRLYGRHPREALDCVGLVGEAISAVIPDIIIPTQYSLRGDFEQHIHRFFEPLPFQNCAAPALPIPGDIILAKPEARQAHLLVWTNGGFVHAHAGLRRTVFTPGMPCWPIVNLWRYLGD
jgi:murein DD-endopeptidase / murein LD-carboxypeptidase